MTHTEARSAKLRDFWSADETFSDRAVDYAAQPFFAEATRQIAAVSGSFDRLVEVGCGSGRYLAHLVTLVPFKSVLGTDIANPRLERAQAEHPTLEFEAGEAVRVVSRNDAARTLVLAMNVLGNLSPDEVEVFFNAFTALGVGLTFHAGGMPIDRTERFSPRAVAFNHNYVDLLRRSRLSILHARFQYDENAEGRAAYVVTAVVR